MNDFTILKSSDLDEESRLLIKKASDALQHSYAPYSNFRVATAVLLQDDIVVTGTNQENAAYPSGMCAERVALFSIASQYPGSKIKKLLVLAKPENDQDLTPATSCGPCRQVMLEFEQRQMEPFEVIMLTKPNHWVKAASAASLLPFSFFNEALLARKNPSKK